jgi:hypothetical protein
MLACKGSPKGSSYDLDDMLATTSPDRVRVDPGHERYRDDLARHDSVPRRLPVLRVLTSPSLPRNATFCVPPVLHHRGICRRCCRGPPNRSDWIERLGTCVQHSWIDQDQGLGSTRPHSTDTVDGVSTIDSSATCANTSVAPPNSWVHPGYTRFVEKNNLP